MDGQIWAHEMMQSVQFWKGEGGWNYYRITRCKQFVAATYFYNNMLADIAIAIRRELR